MSLPDILKLVGTTTASILLIVLAIVIIIVLWKKLETREKIGNDKDKVRDAQAIVHDSQALTHDAQARMHDMQAHDHDMHMKTADVISAGTLKEMCAILVRLREDLLERKEAEDKIFRELHDWLMRHGGGI